MSWDRRSPAEQRRTQDRLLRRWLVAAATYSPFWGDWLADAGVDPAAIGSVDELRRIPPVREVDVAAAGGQGGPALLLRPTEEQIREQTNLTTLVETTLGSRRRGPTGTRPTLLSDYKPVHLQPARRGAELMLAYSRSDLDRLHRVGARAASVLGLRDTDYLVSAVPADGTLNFWGVYHLALGSSILAVHPRGLYDPVTAAAVGFELVPATAVAVPAGEAIELATALGDLSVDLARVRTVVLVGPPPAPDLRSHLLDVWWWAGAARDLSVVALWGSSGGRALWAECAESAARRELEGSGLHTYPDLEVVELLDPVSATPAIGGDLTITSAGWHGTALIRYRTGDYAAGLSSEPCPDCGRTVPRILVPVVPAAWQPQLHVDGAARVDLRGAAEVLDRDPFIDAWRVELRGGADDAGEGYVVELAGRFDAADLPRLTDRLAAAVGHPPLQLVVEDRQVVEARRAEAGAAFEDAR